ncbi:hypothetical protein [Aurantiacibacter marinus]|uniref:Uncharacterized protein n=1 Tax=Aurantiacibacter marinus TaxID=874156 RepID=A0A0H0XPV8_9SPHN|nr:hypothetical protein [Aurantiacibacter marinus]KLI63972.1 hypothetical protein AAV99_09805 [Aurantiacibacter marinus]
MIRILHIAIAGFIGLAVAAPAQAQQERSERMQRLAVAAWTACIADEFPQDVHDLLILDYRTDRYRSLIRELGERRVSEECFNAMPRAYRRIELGGLPFAGGLAEQMIEMEAQEPLVKRLSMAVIGEPVTTHSYTDQVASCMVLGAPNLAADLFATAPASDEETAAFAQLELVQAICTQSGSAIEATPLAMRSMLATASFRILAAQNSAPAESDDDA